MKREEAIKTIQKAELNMSLALGAAAMFRFLKIWPFDIEEKKDKKIGSKDELEGYQGEIL